jgi:hypothetical protein
MRSKSYSDTQKSEALRIILANTNGNLAQHDKKLREIDDG